MRCPNCLSNNVYVIDSRNESKNNSILRRRKCSNCNHRWSTREISEENYEEYKELKKSHSENFVLNKKKILDPLNSLITSVDNL